MSLGLYCFFKAPAHTWPGDRPNKSGNDVSPNTPRRHPLHPDDLYAQGAAHV
ncbi:MAG: hypothetical protein GY952_03410 [Rhodobacteraceae bacterium]|nr:hypothetical protein [Paracoccaceae bacterium]